MDTSFCSRCGFLLTGTAEIMKAGGVLAYPHKTGGLGRIWQNRGFKQGLFILLLTLIVVPIATLIAIGLRIGPFLPIVVTILLAGSGVLRMLYALMFYSSDTTDVGRTSTLNSHPESHNSLPSQQSMPAWSHGASGVGNWRDTNDLEPLSVTEYTTKLLEKEERR